MMRRICARSSGNSTSACKCLPLIHAIPQLAQLLYERPDDDSASIIPNRHRRIRAILVIFAQSLMLMSRRWIFVVARRVNAMSPAPEPALIPVQPTAPRIDDDVAPSHGRDPHERQ
jgi:hypothetical protein